MRPVLGRAALLGGLVAVVALVSATSAFALSGSPLKIAFPKKFASGHPAVAVDGSGTAYIAWINEEDLPPVKPQWSNTASFPPARAHARLKA